MHDVSVRHVHSTEEAIFTLSGPIINGAVLLPTSPFPFEKELKTFASKWRLFGVKFFFYKGKVENFFNTLNQELIQDGFKEDDAREAFVSDLHQKLSDYSKATKSEIVRMDMRVGRFVYNPLIRMHRDAQTYLCPFTPSFFVSFVGPGTVYKPYAYFNEELYSFYRATIEDIYAFISRCEYDFVFLKRLTLKHVFTLPFLGDRLRLLSFWIHSEDCKKVLFTKLESLPTQATLFYHPGIVTGLWHRAPAFLGPRIFVKVSGFSQ